MILVRIALTSPKKFKLTAAVIKWRLKTDYCHACVISLDKNLDLYDVSQAAHGMVHEMDLDLFKEHNEMIKVYHVMMTQEQIQRGRLWLKKQRGKSYSILGAIASTIGIFRRWGIGKNGDKEFMCSEFAFRFLEESLGVNITEAQRADDYIDPWTLEGLLNQLQDQAYSRAVYVD